MLKLRAGIVIALNLVNVIAYIFLTHRNGTDIGERVNTIAFFMFPMVGALLLNRHPRNPIGYLITILGMSVMAAGTLFEYASLALNEQTAWFPLTAEAAWASMILWSLVLPCLILTLLYFPNGRLPGPKWKALAIFPILVTLPVLLAIIVIAWRNRHELVLMDLGQVQYTDDMGNLMAAFEVWNLAMIAAVILALVSFISRYKRAQGIERQQLKWFVFGLTTIPISMVIDELLILINSPLLQGFNYVLNIVSIIAFPVVTLIAITRYRLYDIDIIIRRTLLYSALTLTLTLIYFSAVVFLQMVFSRYLGGQSSIVIVLSTMLIAAVFQPLRLRFQSIINRRFYRSKYNTEQVLASFSSHMQNEVDLDEILRFITGVVEETIQPEQVTFWLIKK